MIIYPVFPRHSGRNFPKSDFIRFTEHGPGCYEVHWNTVTPKLSELKRLKRFFDSERMCFYFGEIKYESLEKSPGFMKLARRAGFMHSYNTETGEVWSLYRS